MTDMTEEEADALDEYFTKNLPKTNPSKGGITTRQGFRMVALDRVSEDYLLTMALATQKGARNTETPNRANRRHGSRADCRVDVAACAAAASHWSEQPRRRLPF